MANTGQCHLRVANTLLDIIEYVTILTINIKSLLYLSSQVIQWCSRNILSRPSQWPRQRLETEARSRQLEILQRQVQKSLFYAVLLTALFNTLARGDLRVICSIKFGFNESMGYSRKTHDPAFICLNSIPACDRRTDRQTDTPTVASTRRI